MPQYQLHRVKETWRIWQSSDSPPVREGEGDTHELTRENKEGNWLYLQHWRRSSGKGISDVVVVGMKRKWALSRDHYLNMSWKTRDQTGFFSLSSKCTVFSLIFSVNVLHEKMLITLKTDHTELKCTLNCA